MIITKIMKKIYITTAIPYVNASPHLGQAMEFIQADAVARYHRLIGNEVFFVSGVDENSLKNVLSAEKAGEPVADFVKKNSDIFYKLMGLLNISIDDFIRTTEKRHILGAKKIWGSYQKDIYSGEYEGLYCVGCEDFFKEEDLINGVCPDHKTKPEFIKEKNYFFRLSKYQDWLQEVYDKNIISIIPENRKAETINFIKNGLRDFSISRSKERSRGWGIEVPNDESQIMYVWADALSNYITALGYGLDSPLYRSWWEDETTDVWHFIGKNITKFHCIYWPAILKSAGLRLPSKIIVHGFITSEGEKMSKSLGNVLSPFDLVEEWGVDVLRYYLLREFSLSQDGDFRKDSLLERYNNELANGIGNLFSRVLTMIDRNGGEIAAKSNLMKNEIDVARDSFNKNFGEFKINLAVDSWLHLATQTDAFINKEKPWELENSEKKDGILSSLWIVLKNLSEMIYPFMPSTSQKMRDSLGLSDIAISLSDEDYIGKTFRIKKAPPLFPRK